MFQKYIYLVYVLQDVGQRVDELSERELLWIRERMAEWLNIPPHHVLIQPQWVSYTVMLHDTSVTYYTM